MENGKITKIEKDLTTIVTDDFRVIQTHTLFLPIRFKEGDNVELEGDRIVLRL